jgi:hypothetical protein
VALLICLRGVSCRKRSILHKPNIRTEVPSALETKKVLVTFVIDVDNQPVTRTLQLAVILFLPHSQPVPRQRAPRHGRPFLPPRGIPSSTSLAIAPQQTDIELPGTVMFCRNSAGLSLQK